MQESDTSGKRESTRVSYKDSFYLLLGDGFLDFICLLSQSELSTSSHVYDSDDQFIFPPLLKVRQDRSSIPVTLD